VRVNGGSNYDYPGQRLVPKLVLNKHMIYELAIRIFFRKSIFGLDQDDSIVLFLRISKITKIVFKRPFKPKTFKNRILKKEPDCFQKRMPSIHITSDQMKNSYNLLYNLTFLN